MENQNEQDLMAKRVAEDEERRERKRKERSDRVQYWEEYLRNLYCWIIIPLVLAGLALYGLYRLILWMFF